MTSPNRLVGAVTLTPGQAHQLWNWTLSRQGLHPDTRLASATAIADASLGLHAARLPSPYATALARATAPAPDIALTVITPRPGLTTLRCMRKTLHLLPLDLAAAAHAATAHYRLRDAERLARGAGVTRAVLATATRSLNRDAGASVTPG